MKIAIIGAMEVEVDYLISLMKDYQEKTVHNHKFYEGELFNHDIITCVSGIGKVSSGMLVSTLINNFENIDLIINIGISGGVRGKIKATDVVVANKLSYADSDVSVFGSKYVFGQMPNCPPYFEANEKYLKILEKENVNFGMILTGDKFFSDEVEVMKIIERHFRDYNVLCLDMESTAFAQASYFYNVDYLAIRAISDIIGNDKQDIELDDNLDIATKNATNILIKLLKNI